MLSLFIILDSWFPDRIRALFDDVTCRVHEDLVSECWIAEGSDLARQGRYDRNLQGADQRAGDVAQVESRWR